MRFNVATPGPVFQYVAVHVLMNSIECRVFVAAGLLTTIH
jgi:hypothetical protein